MAKNVADRPLVPSILDRLLDDEPGAAKEVLPGPHQVLRDVKQSVRRDLENLLNTRLNLVTWAPHLTELKRSLANYGLPDLSGLSVGTSSEREGICDLLKTVIAQFEPRLMNVNVAIANAAEPLDRTFHFRIEAMLRTEPAPEPIVFDSDVEPATGNVEVRGSV